MAYVTRLSHFTFRKQGDTLVIESESGDFMQEHDWPEDLSMDDEDLVSELHDRFYIDARTAFE